MQNVRRREAALVLMRARCLTGGPDAGVRQTGRGEPEPDELWVERRPTYGRPGGVGLSQEGGQETSGTGRSRAVGAETAARSTADPDIEAGAKVAQLALEDQVGLQDQESATQVAGGGPVLSPPEALGRTRSRCGPRPSRDTSSSWTQRSVRRPAGCR